MDVRVRELRCLVAIIDEGSFTDAAIALGVSQASVSRTLSALERDLGVRLLRRTSRSVAPTPVGMRVAARARRILAEVDDLLSEATSGHTHLRVGYAWSALGRHTLTLQRRWRELHSTIDLQLVRVNSTTAGLAEGTTDLAVVRRPLDDRRFEEVIVGLEDRYCALASDDPLAHRRTIPLAALAERTLLIDRRTGTTTPELWPADARPVIRETHDLEDWLTTIATGTCVGVTTQATADQYRRPELTFRRVRDADPVAVRLAWWRDDPHPSTAAAVRLLSEIYRAG